MWIIALITYVNELILYYQCICIHTYVCVCVCVYVRTYYIHTHVHTYIQYIRTCEHITLCILRNPAYRYACYNHFLQDVLTDLSISLETFKIEHEPYDKLNTLVHKVQATNVHFSCYMCQVTVFTLREAIVSMLGLLDTGSLNGVTVT